MNNNQGTIINGQNGSEKQPGKGGFKGFVDGIHKKYDAIRYSKGGKWAARLLTLAAIGGTGKFCYDKGVAKGKATAVPTIVTVERIPEEEQETAPEESTVEA